jgi:hypothetical protein
MEHSLRKFDVELRDLRSSLGRMGDFVVGQIEDALRSLAAHDIDAARTTIESEPDEYRDRGPVPAAVGASSAVSLGGFHCAQSFT